jgi:hypothetical protein
MLNLHESADVGIYSTVPYTNTNVEYTSPYGAVELDTLDSGDLRFNTITSQSFPVDDTINFYTPSIDY